eukprot:GHRR01026469.1.p1 GENE.GHRR01026469.1~~GHRR01026469.1.p1  ORF type:complete len:309 (+),score=94.81 GHRR01026469.1:1210-2136(+)
MMLARVVQLRYSKAGISSLPPSAQVAQPLGSTSISQCGLDPHNSSQEQPCSCMEPGRLSNHDPVLLYMQQLDEHKKRCELTGRYAEAAAAAARIQDLKSAQGQRMHGELVSMQHRELSHLQQTYQQETQAFDQQWAMRIAACEQGVAAQLTGLRAAHEAQLAAFVVDAETRRPTKPQHSAEYLDNRKTEEQLVKQGQYQRAHQLKVAADALYLSELAATQAAWDAEAELRRRKLIAKQQGGQLTMFVCGQLMIAWLSCMQWQQLQAVPACASGLPQPQTEASVYLYRYTAAAIISAWQLIYAGLFAQQ